MKDDLQKIIEDKHFRCIVISPHADDAILSCGGLLSKLVGKTDCMVVNVFTKAHAKPYTLSSKVFLKYSHSTDAIELYKERIQEDKEVLAQLSLQSVDLGLEEALFRRKKQRTFLGKLLPEFDHIYPTYQWHILKKITDDDYAVATLKGKLQQFNDKKTLVFAPYGIGNHVDHRIVRKVSEELFDNVVLYSDFPYNVRLNTYGKSKNNGKVYRVTPDIRKKTNLIKGYKTQFQGLFPTGVVPEHDEIYFSNKPL
ncbi:MAG TPA: PIG-L family deacetylase [Candidatus Saccharimonadales bacterium]|nr:PIG-L family deacetylase [Candidatus Saccharimonadales bacterium]